jgi:hypothetical protein
VLFRPAEFLLQSGIFIADRMSFGKHALVQDAADQNVLTLNAVKNNMPATLHTMQTGANMITRSAQFRIVGEHPATRRDIVKVAYGLNFAPSLQGIRTDAQEVGFGAMGESKATHELTGLRGKMELFPDTREDVAFGNAAGVAVVDRLPKRGKLRFVLLLLTF